MVNKNYLDPQYLLDGELPLEDILKDSVYYPACRFDGGVIKIFNTLLKNDGVTSFIYCDHDVDEDALVENVRDHVRGYHLLAHRSVKESEFVKGTRVEFPFQMDSMEGHKYERIMEKCLPFCHWFIFERNADFSEEHGPERFSLLYVCGEGVATYAGLYNNYRIAPKCLALIQCDGFSGNWTYFREKDGRLREVMAQNEAGLPQFVINGGIGDAESYSHLDWDEYEVMDVVQPYYRYIDRLTGKLTHDGGAAVYKKI